MSRWRRAGRVLVWGCAAAFALEVVVAVAGLPRCVNDWITGRSLQSDEVPDYVVVLGGGGIPSETGLIRTYYAADVARRAPDAVFVVSLPSSGEPLTNSVGRMKDELVMRGVREASILMEHDALNTHEQAVNIGKLLGARALTSCVMLVTSPAHVRRAYACFAHEGFSRIVIQPAFNTAAEADAGGGVMLRYQVWANLHAQVEIAREVTAMLWYRLKGWI